jgi:ATP-dependent Clp protease ATP-binding subunit ClpB
VIQHRLLDPLSLDLLDGKFKEGQTIRGDVRDGEIVFSA